MTAKVKDFFISYTSSDRSWAEWIAWELESAGYSTVIQAWDFRPGENFVLEMQSAASEAERTLLVLSENYLRSSFAASEWAAAFAQDPTGTQRRLVPVCIGRCEPDGILRALIFIDLVGLEEAAARTRLLEGIHDGRAKPAVAPAFPGGAAAPAFPGKGPTGEAPVAPLPFTVVPPSPRPSRSPLVRGAIAWAAATAFVMAAAWVGLLGIVSADEWTEGRFLSYLQRHLPRPDTQDVVLVRGRDGSPLGAPGPAWRGAHAEMIDALAAAGARVVVFDAHFEQPSEHDVLMAEAIARAQSRGTAVVLGVQTVDVREGAAVPRLAPALAKSPGQWGTLSGDSSGRRLELARVPSQGGASSGRLEADALPVVPSLALQAVMRNDAGATNGVTAVLRRNADAIEVRTGIGSAPTRTIPVLDRRCGFLVDTADDLQSRVYTDLHRQRNNPAVFADLRGKIVVIGFEVPSEIWHGAGGDGPRYEMEIQASAIAQILTGRYLRRPGVAAQFAVILAMGGLAWLLRAAGRGWTAHTIRVVIPPPIARPIDVPTAAIGALVLYAVAAFVAAKSLRVVPRFSYDVLAFLLTYVAVGWATRGFARPRFPRREPVTAERSAVAG